MAVVTQRAVPNDVLHQFLPLLSGQPVGFTWGQHLVKRAANKSRANFLYL